MQAEVKWVDGLRFLGQSASGHAVTMDGSGGKSAPSPMEMVLLGAGGCSSVDVVDGLRSQGQDVTGCIAKLGTERRDTAPRYFTSIHIHFEVTGNELDPQLVEQVCKDSLEKFCSVCLMLQGKVPMTHTFEILTDK